MNSESARILQFLHPSPQNTHKKNYIFDEEEVQNNSQKTEQNNGADTSHQHKQTKDKKNHPGTPAKLIS